MVESGFSSSLKKGRCVSLYTKQIAEKGLRILFILLLILVVTTGCANDTGQVPEEPMGDDHFALSTGNIDDYLPDLIAGKEVSSYDLLPCLENFTPNTWSELEADYGQDWMNPLWTALREGAVSQGREDKDCDEQLKRNYYLGRVLLVSDGAYTEGFVDILMLQWNYDPALYSTAMSELFTAEEETILCELLTYSLANYSEDPFSLYVTDNNNNRRALCLDTYPVDFPFYFALNEKDREDFHAESFGSGTLVECDGLQLTYLNPYSDVYRVITIRTIMDGASLAGIAINDREDELLEKWSYEPLRQLDRISYDDEAWFGSQYDYAYTYSQEEGTKSIVFIIKDGLICGIELTDGLDGAIY